MLARKKNTRKRETRENRPKGAFKHVEQLPRYPPRFQWHTRNSAEQLEVVQYLTDHFFLEPFVVLPRHKAMVVVSEVREQADQSLKRSRNISHPLHTSACDADQVTRACGNGENGQALENGRRKGSGKTTPKGFRRVVFNFQGKRGWSTKRATKV